MMKLIVVFVAVIGVALSDGQENMTHFLYQNQNGDVVVEDLVNGLENLTATDLAYYFFSQTNPNKSVIVISNNTEVLINTGFNASQDTLFIVHGWMDHYTATVNTYIKEAILQDHDVNVFVVDWSVAANLSYIESVQSVGKVGRFIADFIVSLGDTYNLKLNKVELVGFSIGAHVCGCTGAALNGQVDRIVGLDPVGLFFSVHNIQNTLDPTDAKFVQAIHTNDGGLGFNDRLGHADYYPNGGRSQPGCDDDDRGCSHDRSYHYYAESLNTDRFIARLCPSYEAFTTGQCNSTDTSFMGTFNLDTRANGSYFLTTNDETPYARG